MKKTLLILLSVIFFGGVAVAVWDGATNFPGALDDSVSLYDVEDDGTVEDEHHDALAQAVIAVETKVGTGSSTSTDNTVLRGTGVGTSAWGQIDGGDIAAESIDSDHFVDGGIDLEHLAAGIKSGADATVVTGTAGTDGNLIKWNADGDVVDSDVQETQVAELNVAETITGNWVNTDNPWADNEVANDITLDNVTQITNRSVTDLTATNYRVFYSAGGGVPVELAFGASGSYLQSQGASSAPTWATPAGSGTLTTVKNDNSQVGGADIVTLDFGIGLSVTESPDTEQNIVNHNPYRKCVTLNSPLSSDDVLVDRNTSGVTITLSGVYGILYSGTNVVGQFHICQSADITDPMAIESNCNAVDSADITFNGGEDSDTSLNGDVTLADGEWLAWGTTSASSPGMFSACISE